MGPGRAKVKRTGTWWISDIPSEPRSIRTTVEQSSPSITGLSVDKLSALEWVGSGLELARSGHPHPRIVVTEVVTLLYVPVKGGANSRHLSDLSRRRRASFLSWFGAVLQSVSDGPRDDVLANLDHSPKDDLAPRVLWLVTLCPHGCRRDTLSSWTVIGARGARRGIENGSDQCTDTRWGGKLTWRYHHNRSTAICATNNRAQRK